VGLPPAGWLLDTAPLVTRFLQPTVPALEYPRRDLPVNVRFIGMLPLEATADGALPPWWSDLDGLRPVVHVTQGTIANQQPDLFKPAIEGLANEAVLSVIATGGCDPQKLGLSQLPSNARIASSLPYAQLLPKTTIMLTNGGYAEVQLALAYGVPLIVAGASEDKPEVAARVAHSGAGIDLRTGKPSAAQVQRAVRALLRDGRYRERARALRHEFGRYDSVQLGANAVEDLLPDALREVTGVRNRAS
jgi:UDP:flavonoid glycosyltransferase YjiC (YdhE family)